MPVERDPDTELGGHDQPVDPYFPEMTSAPGWPTQPKAAWPPNPNEGAAPAEWSPEPMPALTPEEQSRNEAQRAVEQTLELARYTAMNHILDRIVSEPALKPRELLELGEAFKAVRGY